MRKAIEDYNMIEEGDKIAVCLSGGKDSITMLNGLKALQRFYPKHFEIIAISINPGFEFFDKDILQKSVSQVVKSEDTFRVRLKKGLFWYYFETNRKPTPKVLPENTYPCMYINPQTNNEYLFRVTYYGKRINLEVFHVLTDGNGAFQISTEDFYGRKIATLTPSVTGEQMQDSIFSFCLDRYYSPTFRLYDYWERHTGLPVTDKEKHEQEAKSIKLRPFEYMLSSVEVTAAKEYERYSRPPHSEMRFDFLDEWEYAQDVTYLTNRIDPWDPTGYRSHGHYESPFVNHIFDHSTPYGIKEYSLGAPTLSSFDRYVMGSNGGLNSGGNGIVVDVFGGMNKIRRQSSFLIQDPAYHNTLTAVDIMRSAFWRHNLNWCYWIQGMVLDGEYHTEAGVTIGVEVGENVIIGYTQVDETNRISRGCNNRWK